MITQKQIEEWMKEAELRPASGPLLIKMIAERMRFLAERNEELLSETIELRNGTRVEELEGKLAALENQLQLLKRRYGNDVTALTDEKHCLLVFSENGRIARFELDPAGFEHGASLGNLNDFCPANGEGIYLLAADAGDELLALFESGRTASLPADAIPAGDPNLFRSEMTYQSDTRGYEKLCCLLPIAALPLFDFSVQVSRRGFIKRSMRDYFQSHIASDFIGNGVKLKADQPFGLFFANSTDQAVLVSHEGSVLGLPVSYLPYNPEESFKLTVTDHVIGAFNLSKESELMMVTNQGQVVRRDAGWLTPSESLKVRGHQLIPASRLERGTRAVALTPWQEKDWAITLTTSGTLILCQAGKCVADGRLPSLGEDEQVIDFKVVFSNIIAK